MPSLSSVGDISFSGGFDRTHPKAETWVTSEVRELLRADICLANLECVLVEAVPRDADERLCLAAAYRLPVRALKSVGINVVSLANNHVMDAGANGLGETTRILRANGIRYFGAGVNAEAGRSPLIFDIKGTRVAFLGRVHAPSFVNVTPIAASDSNPGIALLEEDEVLNRAAWCKRENAVDRVVLCVHWGIQNIPFVHPGVHDLALRLIGGDIDVILGHHAHVAQGIVQRGNRFIAFGQGNFYFQPFSYRGRVYYGAEMKRARDSLLFRFDIFKDDIEANIIPVTQTPREQVARAVGRWRGTRAFLSWLGNRHVLLFHVTWRTVELVGLLRGINARSFIRLVRHPMKMVGLVVARLQRPTHR